MRGLKPQTRFLLRGSALLLGALALWWFVLAGPMLYMLRAAAGSFVGMRENLTGDYTLRVPFEAKLPATPANPTAQNIRSIDFDMPRTDVIAFTFSLPVFWAIMLAAPGVRRNIKPLVLGTGLMALIELAMLVAFAHLTAWNAVAQIAGDAGAGGRWTRAVGDYLLTNVLPYILPLILALALHSELRKQVFPTVA